MSVQIKQFLILLAAGLLGVFSFLLADLSALMAILPIPADAEIPPITLTIKILSLIQPSVILLVAVLVGVILPLRLG
jgi:hypothetical protein